MTARKPFRLHRWLDAPTHLAMVGLAAVGIMATSPAKQSHTGLTPVYNSQSLQTLLGRKDTASQFVDAQIASIHLKEQRMRERDAWNHTYEGMKQRTLERLELFRDPDALAARLLTGEDLERFKAISTDVLKVDFLAGAFTGIHEAGGENVKDSMGNDTLGMAAVLTTLHNRGHMFESSTDFAQFSFWSDPNIKLADISRADAPTHTMIANAVGLTAEVLGLNWNDKVSGFMHRATLKEARELVGDAKHYYNPHKVTPSWRTRLLEQGKIEVDVGNHRFVRNPAPERHATR